MKTSSQNSTAGFTIVEMLVTVAIIIVLAALAFTLSRKGMQAASTATTLGNLREIGAGVAGWMSDNNNFFPPSWDNTEGRNQSYAQVLDPYVNGEEDYRKPDSRFISPNKRLPVKVNEYSHPITYSMNHVVCEVFERPEDLEKSLIHGTQVDRLNDVILMIDGCQNPGNLNQANATFYRIQVGKTGPRSSFEEKIEVGPDVDEGSGDGWIRYPGGKAHALMCDGAARVFDKGTITKGNIWIDRVRK
jgi:Tfp pilus assembly protein PilE